MDWRRLWAELRQPSLRCERLGHDMVLHEQHVWCYPSARGVHHGIVDQVTERRRVCARCCHAPTGWIEVNFCVLDRFDCGPYIWRHLRENGRWVFRRDDESELLLSTFR